MRRTQNNTEKDIKTPGTIFFFDRGLGMLSSGGRRIFQGCVRPQNLMSGGGGGGGGISTLFSDLKIFASVFQTQTMGIIGYRGRGPAPT